MYHIVYSFFNRNMRASVGRITAIVLMALCTVSFVQAQQDSQPSDKALLRVQKEVRHELIMLPYLDVFDNLAFKVDGYSVTLYGSVTKPTLKSDAEKVVKGIEGVEKVDNQIEVLPPSPMDDRLRVQLYRAIYGYPSLERYAMPVNKPIRIIVNSGHVRLEGVVDNEADKNVAGIRAKSVSGIFSVDNNLEVAK
jgi:hyperosmotically inducible periplasmic protein